MLVILAFLASHQLAGDFQAARFRVVQHGLASIGLNGTLQSSRSGADTYNVIITGGRSGFIKLARAAALLSIEPGSKSPG